MSAPFTKQKIGRHTRLMRSAVSKLEEHHTIMALTVPEYRAAREVVQAAVEFVNEFISLHPKTKKLPRVFEWLGARYRLEYSVLGRVHVGIAGSKARFSSEVFSI